MLWSEPLYSCETVQFVTDTDSLAVKVMSIIVCAPLAWKVGVSPWFSISSL